VKAQTFSETGKQGGQNGEKLKARRKALGAAAQREKKKKKVAAATFGFLLRAKKGSIK